MCSGIKCSQLDEICLCKSSKIWISVLDASMSSPPSDEKCAPRSRRTTREEGGIVVERGGLKHIPLSNEEIFTLSGASSPEDELLVARRKLAESSYVTFENRAVVQ